ncbi:patatin-domain-containing protein [Xylona heveae TC161]|uniref:Patatin-like phospholipase domain-containing protein n=1 Tax=Xylona heveae (strain CBS 132557 / TC161) TaxID=1328760 RepID=A0A165IMY6_XYLHT|nr:patatin-domain-containing protein [Xylona heveae TC161]KZF25130.1 patatin-domain-containing protein [Xylona heveae TC161]
MADKKKSTDGPSPYTPEAFDAYNIPDYDTNFVHEAEFSEFAKALAAPENSNEDVSLSQQAPAFITALNDWRPVHQKVRGRRKSGGPRRRRPPKRGKDETREGFVYTLLKWPMLVSVLAWIIILGIIYIFTRLYIYFYEQFVTWRGTRQRLRRNLQSTKSYGEWVEAAKELDKYLGNEAWKKQDEYAYYDHKTVKKAVNQLRKLRQLAEAEESPEVENEGTVRAVDELRGLIEACVKSNFVGVENPRLYSETYHGTKDLVQTYTDEVNASLKFLLHTDQLSKEEKRSLFKHVHTNFGRSALCLSGGACFAYYHFGVIKALLDADLLPQVITGTSGGALVAALVATRTNEELKATLVPALAGRITACHDDFLTWVRRWYRTGARFDSIDWARRCSWFCRGSMTFREAYERTGRILNVSCVPSDPHSPTILANYLTSPDCVIWSAVLASAAVPGILNPVVLMKKNKDGTISPYSFGHKWKDGSLRTDIPLKALNLHFNVNFSIVSQVNPHVNLFFFGSRGSVGRPVTHRRGRGWRGGFLGSATEQYLKLDLTKWLKVLRHLELLPRPLGQDWSEIWLQRFSGTITIWPKTIPSDFYYILSDPSPQRLARMLHVGQQSTFPKLVFIGNRMKNERIVESARRATRPQMEEKTIQSIISEEDLRSLVREVRQRDNPVAPRLMTPMSKSPPNEAQPSAAFSKRFSDWLQNLNASSSHQSFESHPTTNEFSGDDDGDDDDIGYDYNHRRSSYGVLEEIGRQSRVFLDDSEAYDTEGEASFGSGGVGERDVDGLETDEAWDVEEEKDKHGLEEEREREEDAIQAFEDNDTHEGTIVG